MKNWKTKIPLMVSFTLISAMFCHGSQTSLFPNLSGSVSGGYESVHLYRGVDCAVGKNIMWSSTAISPSSGTNLGIWYGTGPDSDYEEFDAFGSYTFNTDAIDVTVGFLWYHFPGDFADDSLDLNLKLSKTFETESGLVYTPYLTNVYNESAKGWYFESGINVMKPLNDYVSLNVSTWVAASTSYRPKDGLDNATIVFSLPINITERSTLSPYFSASTALTALEDISDDITSAGVTFSITF